jgi:hypothetical protein
MTFPRGHSNRFAVPRDAPEFLELSPIQGPDTRGSGRI